jgi:hypothetical protein
VCSFSARALIYKGMFLAEDIDNFYLDLKDKRFVSAVAIYHQRYSTNTFPQWRLAQLVFVHLLPLMQKLFLMKQLLISHNFHPQLMAQ